jgi:hypothetical protein
MGTVLDSALIPKIKTIISTYGKNVVFTVHGISEYDADEGSVVDSGSTDYTVKATPPENYTRNLIDGDMIRDNDCKISISASGLLFTPENGMKVTFDNQNWKVVGVETGYTGEDIGLYSMQLRR